MTEEVTNDSSIATESTANTEAASAPTPSSETSDTTTQPSTDAAANTAPTPAGAQANGDRSLPSDTRSNQNQPNQQTLAAQQTPPNPYEKRLRDQEAYIGRLARENADHKKYRESWGDLNPQQVRELVQKQQSEAATQKLKPWNPNHPEYASTSARLERVGAFSRTRARILARNDLDPAQKQSEIAAAAEDNGVTNEDVALFRQYDSHRKDFQERFTRDPESCIADIVERRVAAKIGEYDQFRTTTAKSEQWLNDPAKAELLAKHADDVLWAMSDQTPRREVGITIAKLKAENEALRARVGGQREVVESAAAQQAALRKRSTVTRDAVTASVATDPVNEGQKQGLQGTDLLNYLRSKRRTDE